MPPHSGKSTPIKTKPVTTTKSKTTTSLTTPVRIYLISYNIISALSWSYCLFVLISHLIGSENQAIWLIKGGLQPIVDEIIKRAGTAYFNIGSIIQLVQTLALLEPIHAALGLVRSGVVTTIAQVASRIFMVWYICPFWPPVAASSFYASMVFAWSFTEVIRYSHYAAGLLDLKVPVLEWLRYSTFYLLYPMGAGSEARLVLLSAEYARYIYGTPAYWATMLVLGIWPPALGFMMLHMHAQRNKHVRGTGGKKSNRKPNGIQAQLEAAAEELNNTPARSTRSSKKLL